MADEISRKCQAEMSVTKLLETALRGTKYRESSAEQWRGQNAPRAVGNSHHRIQLDDLFTTA